MTNCHWHWKWEAQSNQPFCQDSFCQCNSVPPPLAGQSKKFTWRHPHPILILPTMPLLLLQKAVPRMNWGEDKITSNWISHHKQSQQSPCIDGVFEEEYYSLFPTLHVYITWHKSGSPADMKWVGELDFHDSGQFENHNFSELLRINFSWLESIKVLKDWHKFGYNRM